MERVNNRPSQAMRNLVHSCSSRSHHQVAANGLFANDVINLVCWLLINKKRMSPKVIPVCS